VKGTCVSHEAEVGRDWLPFVRPGVEQNQAVRPCAFEPAFPLLPSLQLSAEVRTCENVFCTTEDTERKGLAMNTLTADGIQQRREFKKKKRKREEKPEETYLSH
jgi:hypothetical protein